jgi:hypothetical protein
VDIKPLGRIVYNYILKCVRAFLEGQHSLKWVLGCLRRSGADPQVIRQVVLQAKGYGDANRWDSLAHEIFAE